MFDIQNVIILRLNDVEEESLISDCDSCEKKKMRKLLQNASPSILGSSF